MKKSKITPSGIEVFAPIFLIISPMLKPEWSLAAMLVSIPLTMVSVDAGFQIFSLCEIFIYLALIGWLIHMILVRKTIKFVKSPLNLPVIALMLIYIISYLRAPDFVLASKEFGSIKTLYNIELSCLIYFLVANNVKSKNVRLFTFCLVFAGVVAGVIGFYQYLTGHTLDSPEVKRLTSTLEVAHGAFMVYIFVISLGLMLGTKSVEKRMLLIILMVLFLSQIILSASRGAWISLGFISVCGWLLLGKSLGRKIIRLIFIGLAIISIILTLKISTGYMDNPYIHRLYSGLTFQDYSTRSRLLTWSIALTLVKDNLLSGIGLTGFREHYKQETKYDSPPELTLGERGIAAHNIYLDTTLQTGVIGLGILLWLFIVAFREAYALYRNAHSSAIQYLGFGIFLAIIHIMVWGLADSPFFHMSANNIPFFTILGLLSALKISEQTSKRSSMLINSDSLKKLTPGA